MNKESKINQLIAHFFRYESGKMIAVLTGFFGSTRLNLAEDIVQETIIEAISNWTYKSVPENPTAWLYKVAKNKALNVLKKEKHSQIYISKNLHTFSTKEEIDIDHLFLDKNILDDQLRMMFVCCHHSISQDSQIALILKTLCGFNISEIAKAFLSNNESINKRLVRARKSIRENGVSFVLPSKTELNKHIDAVLESIYLLFNEGYSASKGTTVIRKGLCLEAIRLIDILIDSHLITEKSDVYALKALMLLNSSRFNAREDDNGNIITLEEQDRKLWDFHIMENGFTTLKKSENTYISKYHILATISAYHCMAKNIESTDWKSILTLYDKLLVIENSAIVLMNRAVIIAKVNSVEKGIEELDKIKNDNTIKSNHLFYAIMTNFLVKLNKPKEAKIMLKKAIELAPLKAERQTLKNRYRNYFMEN